MKNRAGHLGAVRVRAPVASPRNLDPPCDQDTWASEQPNRQIKVYCQSCIVLGSYLTIASKKLFSVSLMYFPFITVMIPLLILVTTGL